MFDKVQDSGKREEFSTGSVRDTRDGKGRFDLISPIALKRLAQHYENGAKKYGDRNWEKGQPLSRYVDSLVRHAYDLLGGKQDEDHAAAIMWNAAAFIHTEHNIKAGFLPSKLDDMPKKKEVSIDWSNKTSVGQIAPGVGGGVNKSEEELPQYGDVKLPDKVFLTKDNDVRVTMKNICKNCGQTYWNHQYPTGHCPAFSLTGKIAKGRYLKTKFKGLTQDD